MPYIMAAPVPLDPSTFYLDKVDTVADAVRVGYFPTAKYSYEFICRAIGSVVFDDCELGSDVDPDTQTWRVDPELVPTSNLTEGTTLPGRRATKYPDTVYRGGPWVYTMYNTMQMANWGLSVLNCVVPNLSTPPFDLGNVEGDPDTSTFDHTRSLAMIALSAALSC